MAQRTAERNAPQQLPLAGVSGPRTLVKPEEQLRRRIALTQLVCNGVSRDEMCTAMKANFGMTRSAVEALLKEVRRLMLDESEEATPYKRAAAEHRLHRAIVSASKRNNWSAVANLESQLARIQGTETPTEVRVEVDARLQQATLHVLAAKTPQQIAELVASEVARLPSTDGMEPPK